MIQQMWRLSQRLLRAMVLGCWVRQLPHDAELKPRRNGSGVGVGAGIVPERLANRLLVCATCVYVCALQQRASYSRVVSSFGLARSNWTCDSISTKTLSIKLGAR